MEKTTASASHKIIRIAITGPESTGKSVLTQALAKHYQANNVRECARDYVKYLDRNYNYFDLLVIAQRQLYNERQKEKLAHRYLFCDTELTVLKIWAMHRFEKCHPWILSKLDEIKYDLYLLCDIDLPWEFDPLREHPDLRQYFFDLYHQELSSRKLPFAVISGEGEERLQNAIEAIDALREKEIRKS
jgi:NadR type nicotinamide-nucleotide adenylyltransferase